jgi:hypothetical protein
MMQYYCEDCFLKHHRVEHSEQHLYPCVACCSTCVTTENQKRFDIERLKRVKYSFTLGVSRLQFGKGRTRNSVYVSNNAFGYLVRGMMRDMANLLGYKIRAKGRTPIRPRRLGEAGTPLYNARHIALYFDKR